MASTECSICAETYNRSYRAPISCEYCDFVACRKCCQTYIINGTIPKCMNQSCGREWSRHFLTRNFTQTFNKTELREHRKQVLFERERSMMPATQPLVELYNESNHLNTRHTHLEQEYNRIRREMLEIGTRRYHIRRRLEAGIPIPNSGEREHIQRLEFVRACPDSDCRGYLSTQWKCGVCEKWTCPDCHEIKGPSRDSEHECKPENVASAALVEKETRPCPNCHTNIFKIEGCFAKDTRVLMYGGSIGFAQDIVLGDLLMGEDGTPRKVTHLKRGHDLMYKIVQSNAMPYVVSSYHTLVFRVLSKYACTQVLHFTVNDYIRLDANVKRTLRAYTASGKESTIELIPVGRQPFFGWTTDGDHQFLLQDETVVHNCNQMFCTKCNTPFDWRTGRPIHGPVHNPHYFEWMRSREGANTETRTQTPEFNCNQELTNRFMAVLSEHIRAKFQRDNSVYRRHPIETRILNTCRNTIHLRHVIYPQYDVDFLRANEQLRVKYLIQEIDEAKFKTVIQANDKKHQRNVELRNVFDLMYHTITDILYRVRDELSRNGEIEPILDEIDQIIAYANEHLGEISETYGSTVVHHFSKEVDHRTIPKARHQATEVVV